MKPKTALEATRDPSNPTEDEYKQYREELFAGVYATADESASSVPGRQFSGDATALQSVEDEYQQDIDETLERRDLEDTPQNRAILGAELAPRYYDRMRSAHRRALAE